MACCSTAPAVQHVLEHDDLALVEEIENAADSLAIELLAPGEWERAVTGSERAALSGFILVSSGTVDGPAVGFVLVIEGDDFAHLEQLFVLPSHGRRGHDSTLVEAVPRPGILANLELSTTLKRKPYRLPRLSANTPPERQPAVRTFVPSSGCLPSDVALQGAG